MPGRPPRPRQLTETPQTGEPEKMLASLAKHARANAVKKIRQMACAPNKVLLRRLSRPAGIGPVKIRHMEIAAYLIDFILNVDKHLETFVTNYGTWVYVLLFMIIFVETGVVVMPFLPGDSLLFVVGAMCGVGLMSFPLVVCLLFVAAVLGDQCNYTVGRYIGPKVFQWEDSRWFNKKAFNQAHDFYERYGGITIIAARFMPFLRTFVPFVAGVAEMTRSRFTLFNVVGAALWVGGIVTAGYIFGNVPFVKTHLDKIIWAMILVPGLVVLFGAWKASRKTASPPA